MIYFRQKYNPKKSFTEEYEANRRIAKKDFTCLAPNKRMEKLKMPDGLYGFTYLGSDYMAINDSLLPEKNYETQVHEAIHTNDEYETRVLTRWMLDIEEKD
jgi:hypothetical protein